MSEPVEPTEAEIDAIIEEFGGDLRSAIRGLLHDITVLTRDRALTVSRGFVRGRSRLGSSTRTSTKAQG